MIEVDYEIVPITFSSLSHNFLAIYKGMLEKEYWHYFKNTKSDFLISRAILYKQEPIGIALAEASPIPSGFGKPVFSGIIYQLSLNKDHSSEELYDKVLASIEEALRKHNCVVFTLTTPALKELDTVLRNRRWQGPRKGMRQYEIDSEHFHPDWFEKILKSPLPPGFSIFKWKNIKQSEWKALKDKVKNGRVPEYVDPFNKYDGIPDPLNSLGLKFKDEVIGWVLTHKIKEKLRYTNLFILKDFEFSSLSIKLLSESISLQKGKVKTALFEFNLQQTPPSWDKFVVKYLAPYAQNVVEMNEWWLEKT